MTELETNDSATAHAIRQTGRDVLRVNLFRILKLCALGLIYVAWCSGQFYRSRADLSRRTGQVEMGMTRAEVERVFVGYTLDDSKFWPTTGPERYLSAGWSGQRAFRVCYSNPARTWLQSHEHAVVLFDERGRVEEQTTYLDP